MEILRILVKRVAKRNHQVRETTGSQHAPDFIHYSFRRDNMFQNGVTLDPCEDTGRKRQMMRVRLNVHSGHSSYVEVDVSGDSSSCASEIKIETPQRSVDVMLVRIFD